MTPEFRDILCVVCGGAAQKRYAITCSGHCTRVLSQKKRVRPSLEERFWKRVWKTNGCWIWKGKPDSAGYGTISINDWPHKAHRISWQITHGELPAGMFVCHHCDNPLCVRPNHLFLGTAQSNKRDCVLKHRHAVGARHPHARLTNEQVCEIRRLATLGTPSSVLAQQFGVAPGHARAVAAGRAWKHLAMRLLGGDREA